MVEVRNLAGAGVTGLSAAGFTLTLQRRSGNTLVASSETVNVLEIGGGKYWIYYVPTVAATLYLVTAVAVSVSHVTTPDHPFQTDVSVVVEASAGPYLTTLANFKQAWNINSDTWDGMIAQLLPQITSLFETECNKRFFSESIQEFPEIRGIPLRRLWLDRAPVTQIFSLHVSTSRPRVYDSTTELIAGTDFDVLEEKGLIEFVVPIFVGEWSTLKAVRVEYEGGYAVVPSDIERAAQEVLGVKLEKGKAKAYHLFSESKNDGSIGGIRFEDLTPNALRVIELHTRHLVA